MSVINKMLRDLDARRAYAPGLPRDFAVQLASERHGRALPLPQLQRPHQAYWTVAVVLVLVAAGMGYFASNFYVLQEKSPPLPRSFVVITADPNLELPKEPPAAVAVAATAPTIVPQAAPAQAVVAQVPASVAAASAQKIEPVKPLVTASPVPTVNAQAVVTKAAVAAAAPTPTTTQAGALVKQVMTAPAKPVTVNPSPAAAVPPITSTQTLVAKPPVPVQTVPAQKSEPVNTQPTKPAVIPVPALTVPARAPVAPAAVVAPPAAAAAKPAAPAPQLVAARPAIAPTPALPSVPALTAAPTPKPISAPASAHTSTPAPQAAANSPAKVQSPPAATVQPNRQAAAQETLANAQSLWNAGSHNAATDLMREAVAMTERAYNAGALPANSPVLASLVRELARMELAEGRSLRVLELLTRLEPALPGQADLWAVRGNAAQRLSRHQESVNAYSRALAIRPDEPRWMLASAVSLAALGRFDESAELVDKAHAAGVVSPEILSYLKQIGVPIKQR